MEVLSFLEINFGISAATMDQVNKATYGIRPMGSTGAVGGSLPAGASPYQKVSVFNNKIWIAGGGEITSASSVVWNSGDGTSWNVAQGLASAIYRHVVDVIGGKLWLWGGVNGSVQSAAQYSSDGQTWTTRSATLPGPLTDMSKAKFNGRVWIAAGNSGGGGTSAVKKTVMSSSDGMTWVVAGNLPATRRYGSMISYNGKLWFMGGVDDGDVRVSTVWSSSDGATWSSAGNLPSVMNGAALAVFSPTCGTGAP